MIATYGLRASEVVALSLDDIRWRQGVLRSHQRKAMIVARVLEPASKLATSRALHPDTLSSTLGELLHLQTVTEDELYQAMDWLLPQQTRIEQALAKRHLAEGALVLYDLTSTYFEGRHGSLAQLGHSRDDQKGKLQVVFGLMTNAEPTFSATCV